jgi:hypothetical protein
MAEADSAVYQAKQQGRNRAVLSSLKTISVMDTKSRNLIEHPDCGRQL